jgi:hypothetical protein
MKKNEDYKEEIRKELGESVRPTGYKPPRRLHVGTGDRMQFKEIIGYAFDHPKYKKQFCIAWDNGAWAHYTEKELLELDMTNLSHLARRRAMGSMLRECVYGIEGGSTCRKNN